jgi:DNA helicase-2/ATP-dependent DNA helicase PcrA
MTVFKSKGLEFEHVFLISVHDDIWGKKSISKSNNISLPLNLNYIRYKRNDEDVLRRVLFVAITRSKHGLYLTSHAHTDSGKATEPVKYLMEHSDENGKISTLLPNGKQKVNITKYSSQESMNHIETFWQSRHLELDTSLKSLLKTRLVNYKMSPTHLNSFTDLEHGGPEVFMLNTLMKFPQAPSESGEFGTAIHKTLEWYQNKITDTKKPSINETLKKFDSILDKRFVTIENLEDIRAKGHNALTKYTGSRQKMFEIFAKPEIDFSKEGVLLDYAILNGKIDRLEIDKKNKSVSIADFKTGKPHIKWDKEIKLIKYKQQLYFYKILIEGSHTWQNYKVSEARLEFVEPDSDGNIVEPLVITFDEIEEKNMKLLIKNVWNRIQNLDFPDTKQYSKDYNGVLEFIKLLEK